MNASIARVTILTLCILLNPLAACCLAGDAVLLDIPDTYWDPDRNDGGNGWCGEASIQQAMAFYGEVISQQDIHDAVPLDTLDIRSDKMNEVLDALGVTYEAWDEGDQDLEAFLEWVRQGLRRGHPMLVGVKMYPSYHANWDLDHFLIVVGYDSQGLIMNTQLDLDGKIYVSYEELANVGCGLVFEGDEVLCDQVWESELPPEYTRNATYEGYSFANPYIEYFGREITGVE